MIQPNYRFRAITNNVDEQRAVEQAFAQSVLWGFTVTAEEKDKVLVDATDFYFQDAHDVIGRLRSQQQGTYSLDKSRSAFYLSRTKNFPQNTEVEVTLTFTGQATGGFIRSVTPTPNVVTVRQHHSFVQLPEISISRASLIRVPATSVLLFTIMPRPFMSPSKSVSSIGIGWKRKIRVRPRVNRLSRSSTTWIAVHRNRSALLY